MITNLPVGSTFLVFEDGGSRVLRVGPGPGGRVRTMMPVTGPLPVGLKIAICKWEGDGMHGDPCLLKVLRRHVVADGDFTFEETGTYRESGTPICHNVKARRL